MLDHTQGQFLNAANLARALGVSGVTVASDLDLLVDLCWCAACGPGDAATASGW